MTIDLEMAEIINVFFQESDEGLDAMESGLLSLEGGSDCEAINTIFRAAHSIKGGAGTFGFGEISKFTHAVETLLDQMRNGTRGVSAETVQVLLQAVDAMREMVALARAGTPGRPAAADAVGVRLIEILEGPADPATTRGWPPAEAPTATAVPTATAAPAATVAPAAVAIPEPPLQAPAAAGPADPLVRPVAPGEQAHWRIRFVPHTSLFETCNDPLRMFTQLASLGRLTVQVFSKAVPALTDMEPTQCHLSWTLDLHGAVTREQLVEVFDWVDSNSSIGYERLDEPAPPAVVVHAAPEVHAPAPMPEPPSAPTAAVAPEGPTAASASRTNVDASSIRVGTEKVDALINLVGELVITQSMLGRFAEKYADAGKDLESLRRSLAQLTRNTRELQESVHADPHAADRLLVQPVSASGARSVAQARQEGRAQAQRREHRARQDGAGEDRRSAGASGAQRARPRPRDARRRRLAAGKSETGTLELNAFPRGRQHHHRGQG